MKLVEKALWFIESNFANDINLSEIANAGGVSRYHLLRAFGTATDYSVMRYVRGRRLTEAARTLVDGAPDILTVALSSGYSSHEAFTRAFLDQFGITPKQLRQQNNLDLIQLIEPIKMNEDLIVKLEEPRIENANAMLIAGLSESYTFETNQSIPLLWQRFGPYIGRVPGQIDDTSYGVCFNNDDAGNFDYIAGVEVSSIADLPKEFSHLKIPEHKYLVFSHSDHISMIRKTVHTIWNQWLPNSDYSQSEAPDFERYDERFNPQTGTGIVEIWIPIK